MVKPFIKSETGYNFQQKNISNYTGFGLRNNNQLGTTEAILAFKASESSTNTKRGGFAELKHTTPKIPGSDIAFESRTRFIYDKSETNGNHSETITQRLVGKYSHNLNDNISIYQLMGANGNYSLKDGKFKSVTPLSLTGIGYNITDKMNVYSEIELAQSYNLENKSWEKCSPSVYVGCKINF